MLVDAVHVRRAAAFAAADLGDANAIVGADRARALGGGKEIGRRGGEGRAGGKGSGRFQKFAAGQGR
jgi:hypothetical protein